MGSPKSLRRDNSGQMLVITSLVVALLLLSTVVYVTEIEKNAPAFVPHGNSGLTVLKQATTHTLISALANISNGGDRSAIVRNLNIFKLAVERYSYNTISELNFTVLNSTPYSEGIWISPGNDGECISSVFANLVFNSSGNSASYYSEYAINVTSSIRVNGSYSSLNESHIQVTVTCSVFNEDKPSTAGNLTFYYRQKSTAIWAPATSTNIVDWGNGTYLASFVAQDINQNEPLLISTNCIDSRGVSVSTNTTCLQR
jgi:hypothetical protein